MAIYPGHDDGILFMVDISQLRKVIMVKRPSYHGYAPDIPLGGAVPSGGCI